MQGKRSRLLDLLDGADLLNEAKSIRRPDDRIALVVPIPLDQPRRMGPAEMAKILRAAKAPEPWVNECITVIGQPEPKLKGEDPKYRLRKLLSELRRILPRVIDNEHQRLNRGNKLLCKIIDGPPASAEANRRNVDLADELLQQLNDLGKLRDLLAIVEEAPSLARQSTKDWHNCAIWLAFYYKYVVGDIGVSADGPVVRFISDVLVRLRWGVKTHAAIAQALRRAPH